MKKGLLRKMLNVYVVLSTGYIAYEFIKCRGLGKENDMQLMEDATNRISGFVPEADDVVVINDNELHVSYNPYMQLFTNSMGSIACIINGTNEVYVDNRYRNMSASTQYAILCHEMGHRHNNHVANKDYAINRIKHIMHGQVLNMELEADAYAASIVGTDAMITALQELATYLHGISKKEINLRINHLRKEVM